MHVGTRFKTNIKDKDPFIFSKLSTFSRTLRVEFYVNSDRVKYVQLFM